MGEKNERRNDKEKRGRNKEETKIMNKNNNPRAPRLSKDEVIKSCY